MASPIRLSVIIDGLEMQNSEMSGYLDLETGQVELVQNETLRAAETAEDEGEEDGDDSKQDDRDEAEWDEIAIARRILRDTEQKRYRALPSSFDVHEFAIMEEFCRSVENESLSEELCRAIQGSGAFRRFKNLINEYGIADLWYRFRADALREIAIDWCDAHQIEYEEDEPKEDDPEL